MFQPFTAPGKYIVFKRWDALEEADQPQVVIFFASPDVLSGLFTLANYDEPTNEAVFCPMGAGCATIVQYPLNECKSDRPRAVLGMFDVSARPGVDPTHLTFSVPMQKFERMVANMDESFLITGSWEKIKSRLRKSEKRHGFHGFHRLKRIAKISEIRGIRGVFFKPPEAGAPISRPFFFRRAIDSRNL